MASEDYSALVLWTMCESSFLDWGLKCPHSVITLKVFFKNSHFMLHRKHKEV